jgi:hypothetical protein
MGRRLPRFLSLVALLTILCGSVTSAEEYWEGYDALDRGDYRAALKIYHRLAENGEPRSQDDLGHMYYIGLGTDQDFAKAAKWFQRAADQGHPPSLFNLGILHLYGHGLPRNDIAAHHWFNLASFLATEREARELANGHRERIARNLTASSLQTARKRSCVWWRFFSNRAPKTAQPLDGCAEISPTSQTTAQ